MFTSYRRVFAHPGAVAFSATGLVARLPISMMTLGIVLLVSSLSGSYARAGQVSAAYILGNALVAIWQGRLADRWGQSRVLAAGGAGFAVGTGLLVYAETHRWSLVAADLCAALAGVAIPQVGSMIRARWAHLLGDDFGLHTAFAVESIADEVVYVVGPALVTVLSTMFLAQTGLLVALVVGTVGPLVLAAQRRTEPPAHPRRPLAETARLPWPALVPLTLSTASLGALFGAMDVATVAFCTDVGHRGASGWILAVLSFGSLLAGLVTGARTWRTPVLRRFQVGMATLSVSFVLLTQSHSLWVLGPLMFLAGFAIAPTLIAGFSLLEAVTPRARLTEALGFLQTGISAGIAPGAYLAGVVADHSGGATAYWVCVASGALATAAAFATRDRRG